MPIVQPCVKSYFTSKYGIGNDLLINNQLGHNILVMHFFGIFITAGITERET